MTPVFSLSLTLLFSVGLAAAGYPARAGEPEDAEKHYRNGVTLRAQRQDDQALHEFRHAYALSKAPRTLAQIGLAEQALGLWVDAESHLLEAMSASNDAWIVKNKETLEASLAHVQDRLGSVEVSGGVPQAEVRINGKLMGTLPLAKPIRVVAGSFALEVRAPGHFPLQRSLVVQAKGWVRETVDLVPDNTGGAGAMAAPTTAPATAPGTPGSAALGITGGPASPAGEKTRMPRLELAGWVALGAAGVALGTGVIFHLARQGHVSDFNNDPGCSVSGGKVLGGAGCQSSHADGESAGTKAIVGYVAAAVLGGTAAALLITSKRRSDKGADGVALACGHGPGDFGLACAARF